MLQGRAPGAVDPQIAQETREQREQPPRRASTLLREVGRGALMRRARIFSIYSARVSGRERASSFALHREDGSANAGATLGVSRPSAADLPLFRAAPLGCARARARSPEKPLGLAGLASGWRRHRGLRRSTPGPVSFFVRFSEDPSVLPPPRERATRTPPVQGDVALFFGAAGQAQLEFSLSLSLSLVRSFVFNGSSRMS